MAWKFNNEAPIYLQIMDEIKFRIAQGKLKPGDQVPPVRELAMKAGVNPNTMQKALAELEREGVLYSQRTSGRYVAEPENGVASMRNKVSRKYAESYVTGMRGLGYDDRAIVERLEDYLEEEKNEQYS